MFLDDLCVGLEKGYFSFVLDGEKFFGCWYLICINLCGKQFQWFLVKVKDGEVCSLDCFDVLKECFDSVFSECMLLFCYGEVVMFVVRLV